MNQETLGVQMAPADIIAFQGRGLLSRLILAAQGTPHHGASHVALVLTCNPPVILEATHPRVRVRPLATAVNEAEHTWVLHNRELSDAERERIITEACSMSSLPYGYETLVLHALNLSIHY